MFLFFRLLTYHMETTAEGLIFLETTYYLSESIENPLKGAVFLRFKIHTMWS